MDNNENRKLAIGDKVCSKRYNSHHGSIRFNFSEVERTTNTLAILKNGIKLVNTPHFSHYDKIYDFYVYGDRIADNWILVTPKVLEDYEKEKQKEAVCAWFIDKKFTFEEKESIYKLLNSSS